MTHLLTKSPEQVDTVQQRNLTKHPFAVTLVTDTMPSVAGRRIAMATESIGRMVILDDDMAERMIKQIEEFDKNPPKPNMFELKWGDPDRFAQSLKEKYGYDK